MKKENLKYVKLILILFWISLGACSSDDNTDNPVGSLQLAIVRVGATTLDLNNFQNNNDAPIDKPIVVSFSSALSQAAVEEAVTLRVKNTSQETDMTFSFLDSDKTFSALPDNPLNPNVTYVLDIANILRGANNESFSGYQIEFTTTPGSITITSIKFNGVESVMTSRIKNVPPENTNIEILFSEAVAADDIISSNFTISSNGINIPVNVSTDETNTKVILEPNNPLKGLLLHQLIVSSNVSGANQEEFVQYAKTFYTGADDELDFPAISDDALLTLVQEQTFKYFWDLADPASGMARERNNSGTLVTSGGSGFGLMAIIVGIERNFISRAEGLQRLDRIVDFLETSDRFHGAWPHWINGNTGDVIPFSSNDNGGDLVETSFLVQGLITFRQYLNPGVAAELSLIERINTLWEDVEWDWYTRGGQDVLYWHWSPDKAWAMNHQVKGYNEALITYVLAAASPTHTIDDDVYREGWASSGGMKNGKNFFNITLPLGFDYGGPLFFAHYSFLGLDPRELNDTYASYWEQNVNHSRINHAYVVSNPKNFIGYSDENWGLTASDNQAGYSAHSPTNDLGVITPTAALSSFPYTPVESTKALRFFYYQLGDRLWDSYGFYDAFNLTENWTANSYLAIDQGPIIIMIENYRTGLLWDLFMSAPEVQNGLTKLGFTY